MHTHKQNQVKRKKKSFRAANSNSSIIKTKQMKEFKHNT